MDQPSTTLPPCPITGRPARRLIHGVSARTIEGIWKFYQRIDVTRLFKGIDRLRVYESDTGLVFFEPKVIGDDVFYRDYYARWRFHDRLSDRSGERVDYRAAAKHVPDGAEVIDVGCGRGAFRGHLGQARYTGLDPYAGADADGAVVRETLEAHAETHAGRYDVASAFHVIEHVADPRRHAELMARLLKPGGLLILAAPLHPSLLSEIPNLPINIPPHHVTWWNPDAYRALASELGLEVVEATTLTGSPYQDVLFWLHRLLPRRADPPPNERFVAHRWAWHASLAIAYPLARMAARFKPVPSNPGPIDAFLVARKPS